MAVRRAGAAGANGRRTWPEPQLPGAVRERQGGATCPVNSYHRDDRPSRDERRFRLLQKR